MRSECGRIYADPMHELPAWSEECEPSNKMILLHFSKPNMLMAAIHSVSKFLPQTGGVSGNYFNYRFARIDAFSVLGIEAHLNGKRTVTFKAKVKIEGRTRRPSRPRSCQLGSRTERRSG